MSAGLAFRKEREARGITLEEAASALRVGRKYLHGVEEGNYDGWPAKVFSSGYIKAYAKFLSMDPEPVLTEYYHHLEKKSEGEPDAGYSVPAWIERERRKGSRRAGYALAAAVVLVIGLALAWYGARTSSIRVPAPPPAAVPSAEPSMQDNTAASAVTPGDNAAPPPSAVQAPAESAPAAPGSMVTSVGGAGPVKAPYQLLIEASEIAWLMYGIDEGEPVDVTLYPGDKMSIQARKKIFLKLGNAGGVVGTLNGKLLPPFGARGQVKEILLGE